MAEPIELSDRQCRELLAAGHVGRVAISTPVGPHIVPVNYAVDNDTVVLRTTPYSVVGTHGAGAMMAFEVDQLDQERRRGWSVVARGRAEAITEADELHRIRQTWESSAWADGPRNLVLRLRWSELTGRRLGAGWNPVEELSVSRVV